MYKFTNGMVAYDKELKENLLKAGYKLISEKQSINEVIDEHDNTNGCDISQEHSRNDKKVRKNKEQDSDQHEISD